MLLSPRNRICPSLNRVARSKTRRQAGGLRKGNNPSITSISAPAPSRRSQKPSVTTAYLRGPGDGDCADEGPRIARKNSLLGSITITSDLVRKVARYASRLR